MCNKNGEPHPLTKFPPSEWEVRWKHKSVVEGIAICNERDLPYHGVLRKAREGKAMLCLYEGGLRFIWDFGGWWTINLHTRRTKLTNSYNDEQFGFHIQLSWAKPWWAMEEGIEWNLVMNKKCLIRGIKNEWDFMATLWSHYDFARYSSCYRSNHLLWYNQSLAIKTGLISKSSTSLCVNPQIMS